MASFPGFGTVAIHAGQDPEQWEMNQVVPPISVSSTYQQPAPGQPKGHEYNRMGNPTRDSLNSSLAALEGAKHCVTFASGVAATSAVINLLKQGDHIVCSDDVYAGTVVIIRDIAVARHGMEATFLDFTKEGEIEKAFKPNTKMVWLESPSNPLLKVVDIEAVVTAAKIANPDILVVVDNTFMTPYFQRPLSLGADIVVHSLSKYINGHDDVIMGATITNNEDVRKSMRYQQEVVGAVPSPFDCFLVNRGIKTLHVRMEAHYKNALHVAQFLETSDRVEQVFYPALPSHPQHAIHKKQAKGMSGIVSFYIKGGAEEAKRFFKALKVFTLAQSLGGVSSLANSSSTMTHASLTHEHRAKLGITDNLIRLSVGLEDKDDLVADLEQALNEAAL